MQQLTLFDKCTRMSWIQFNVFSIRGIKQTQRLLRTLNISLHVGCAGTCFSYGFYVFGRLPELVKHVQLFCIQKQTAEPKTNCDKTEKKPNRHNAQLSVSQKSCSCQCFLLSSSSLALLFAAKPFQREGHQSCSSFVQSCTDSNLPLYTSYTDRGETSSLQLHMMIVTTADNYKLNK